MRTSLVRGLDLFCGGGGATAGYMRGFPPHTLHMTGVDHHWQPRYIGDDFIEQDVFDLLSNEAYISSFDFIHASPPCQFFSPTRTVNPVAATRHEDLLTPILNIVKTRYRDKIWVIENVPEAPMYSRVHQILRLCATTFPGHSGFDERRLLQRHRNFRLHNLQVPRTYCRHNGYKPLGVYGALNSELPGGGEMPNNMAEAKKLMQIEWMLWHELKEAIPPAYTEYISVAPGGLRDSVLSETEPSSAYAQRSQHGWLQSLDEWFASDSPPLVG